MIGDKLIIKPYHLPPAREILNHLKPGITKSVVTIAIGGESGSGKSTLASALKEVCAEQQLNAFIFHMDDYFRLPPTDNHNQRLEDINFVGPQEVNLDLLQSHINAIVEQKVEFLEKPLVHYKENEIRTETIDCRSLNIIIIEGTYTMLLNTDYKVFIDRNYKDTYAARVERARDEISPFVESVLEIEHQILQKHKSSADLMVDNDYTVVKNPSKP